MEEQPHPNERRGFLFSTFSLLSLITACETDKVKSSGKGEEFDIATAPELALVGGAVKMTSGAHNGGNPVLIVRIAPNAFSVLTSICTHQGCEVNLPVTSDQVACPCHKTIFSTSDGSVIKGPATAPLRKYAAAYNADTNKLTIAF